VSPTRRDVLDDANFGKIFEPENMSAGKERRIDGTARSPEPNLALSLKP
jgi:hypothetical protein